MAKDFFENNIRDNEEALAKKIADGLFLNKDGELSGVFREFDEERMLSAKKDFQQKLEDNFRTIGAVIPVIEERKVIREKCDKYCLPLIKSSMEDLYYTDPEKKEPWEPFQDFEPEKLEELVNEGFEWTVSILSSYFEKTMPR